MTHHRWRSTLNPAAASPPRRQRPLLPLAIAHGTHAAGWGGAPVRGAGRGGAEHRCKRQRIDIRGSALTSKNAHCRNGPHGRPGGRARNGPSGPQTRQGPLTGPRVPKTSTAATTTGVPMDVAYAPQPSCCLDLSFRRLLILLYTTWAAQLGHPPAPGGRLRGTKARVAAGNQAAMHGSLLTATGHGGARCCKMCCLALIVASTHSILRELMV